MKNPIDSIYQKIIIQQYLKYRQDNSIILDGFSDDDIFLIDELYDYLQNKSGYIYIANNNINVYYKVGMTKQHPSKRLKSLNSAGVFYELSFVRVFKTYDVFLEHLIHQTLYDLYPKAKFKEFFKLPLNLIEHIIQEELDRFNSFLSMFFPKHYIEK